MGKRLLPLLLSAALLTGCSQAPAEDETLHILATTYPVYLFTTSLTHGLEGVEVSLLVRSQTSCLHDYTLTVQDMKAIEGSDVIVMSGGGLEDFMSDALAQSHAAVIDCSQGIKLLPALEEHGHEDRHHDEEWDPHYWMDPDRAALLIDGLAASLPAPNEGDRESYRANADSARAALSAALQGWRQELDGLSHRELITFHDGFQYFAQALDLRLLKAIEEEAGATASAAEIREIAALVREYELPAIFTEKNGSSATAETVARERQAQEGAPLTVAQLDLLMSGSPSEALWGIQGYIDLMDQNVEQILEALS